MQSGPFLSPSALLYSAAARECVCATDSLSLKATQNSSRHLRNGRDGANLHAKCRGAGRVRRGQGETEAEAEAEAVSTYLRLCGCCGKHNELGI